MASEQIIHVNNSVGDNKPDSATVTSEQIESPTSGCAVPETEHKGGPETHAATSEIAARSPEGGAAGAVLGESGQDRAKDGQVSQEKSREAEEENDRTDREFSETLEKLDSVLLEEQTNVSGGETTAHVPSEETTVSGGEAAAQVPSEETNVQVSGGETTAQVLADDTTAQVSGGETSVQVPAEETTAHVSGGEFTAQDAPAEDTAQVPLVREAPIKQAEDGATESAGETTVQVSEETSPPAPSKVASDSASQEASLQVTTGEDVGSRPVGGTGSPESVTTQVTKEGEAWIATLVENIVQEVTAEDSSAGRSPTDSQAHVFKVPSDSSTAEEGGHSCAGHEQVTLEETGAAESAVQAQVSIPDIIVQEACEEATSPPGQPAEAGRQQVGLCSTGGVTQQETGGQVEAAQRDVTPDLVTVPNREGTTDPGQTAACREKEWLPLICTGSEVRADTAELRGTDQGTVPEQTLCPGTPVMKDREMVEDGVTLTPETPIEREIRLAMEREMTLRQERGISVPVGEPELVEVRRRTVVVDPGTLPGKERQLAGAQMQREIQLETQRELDLVEQGKVMGTYDRGPQQELQEKKLIFESMKTESSDPVPFTRRQNEIQRSGSTEVLVDLSVPSNHMAPAFPAAEVKKGPSYAEANGSNIIIIEHASILRKSAPNNFSSPAPADLRKPAPAESRRSTPADLRFTRPSSGGSPLPNSESPVATPGSPFQVHRTPSPRSILEREIEEVQERERELRKQRTSIYGRGDDTVDNYDVTPDNRSDILSGVYQPERPNWGKLEVNWPPNKSTTVNGQQDQAWDSPRTRRQRSTLIQSWESGNPSPADDN